MKIEKNGKDGLVWAQMRYCPYWPAKLVDTPPQMGRTPKDKTCVLFFGTKNFGFVEKTKIKDYAQHRETCIKKGRSTLFHDSVKQIDEFIEDPEKYHSNAFVKPTGGKKIHQIRIKTEAQIEQNLGIKQENQLASNKCRQITEYKSKPTQSNEDFGKEKQKLIDAYVALKSENQKLTFDLKTKHDECAKLISEKLRLEQEAVETSIKISGLESNLSRFKSEHAQELDDYKKKLFESNQQNETLSICIKKLQTEKAQNSRNENDVYEVEKIIDEKKEGKTRYFLIRWKGFGPNDDTWERESNLLCPTILKEYLQTKNTN